MAAATELPSRGGSLVLVPKNRSRPRRRSRFLRARAKRDRGDVDDVFFSACSPLLTSHDQEIENEHEDENDWREGNGRKIMMFGAIMSR
jgi:hypothetical protein